MSASSLSEVRRMPSLFLSHGAGPCFFMKSHSQTPSFFRDLDVDSKAAAWYRQISVQTGLTSKGLFGKPKSIVIVSAHWETDRNSAIRITNQAQHNKLLYDYGGFPEETYKLEYSPPGSPSLSKEIKRLCEVKGIPAVLDSNRNFDHGVFIPLKLIFPNADIPVVQISLNESLDNDFHFKLGEALSPLRSEGVLIIGSGQMTHGRGDPAAQEMFAESFHKQMTEIYENKSNLNEAEQYESLKKALLDWQKIPNAHKAHPRTEHFIPFIVAAAAAITQSNSTQVTEADQKNDKGKGTTIERIGNCGPPGISLASYLFN